MGRLGLFLAMLIAITTVWPERSAAAERVVNVYNWSDYVDPDVLADFTAETGVAVVYDVFDANDLVETKLLAGGSGYDVVVSSDVYVAREIAAGVLQPLDKTRLPNLVHQWPAIADALGAYDPGNRFAVNYMWGTTGLGYNVDKVQALVPDAPRDSWALLFDPRYAARLSDCGIRVLDTPDDVIPAALSYLGLDPRSQDPDAIRASAAAVARIRPYIERFESDGMINALAAGDACLVLGYSGDVLQARSLARTNGAGAQIDYVIPKEGTAISFDGFVIPADAPHPDEAHLFIDFMVRPENAARNASAIAYASGSLDAQPLIDKIIREDPAIYPDAATLARLYALPTRDATVQRLMNRLWATIKSGSAPLDGP